MTGVAPVAAYSYSCCWLSEAVSHTAEVISATRHIDVFDRTLLVFHVLLMLKLKLWTNLTVLPFRTVACTVSRTTCLVSSQTQ